ncbi:MAG: AAA family ATPase, partial [Saprospiraceae bacterium]
DEIDTYLHPSWQKNILNVITKKFPNVRTVVTTHSPLVLTHIEEYEKCNVLLITPDGIKNLEHFYGTQISSAFNIMTDVKERHSKVQKLIDDIFMLLEEDPTEALIAKTKDEIQSLKKIRGSHDPVMSELENMFNFWSTYED